MKATNSGSIDVIDFADYSHPEKRTDFINRVGRALSEIGFFALENHGLDASMLKEAYALSQEFFSLSLAVKQKYELAHLKGQRGYIGFGREHAKDSTAPDLKEFWHVGREVGIPPSEKYEANLWPQEIERFRSVFCKMYADLEHCTEGILEACALYLGASKSRMSSIAEGGNSILRLIHYPPIFGLPHPESIRAAAHEDINLITLLCESTGEGLQIKERDGSWRAITSHPGHIIVDSGDMLQNLTNGFYKSTTHRVVNPKDPSKSRFSMPFFCHPRSDVSLEPMVETLKFGQGKALWPTITAGDYLQQRLAEIGLKPEFGLGFKSVQAYPQPSSRTLQKK